MLYNLYNHNCNQVAQTILSAGGKDFAVTDFDFFDTMPNRVIYNLLNDIFRFNEYKNRTPIANQSEIQRDFTGWKYGKISDLYQYVFTCR